MPKDRRHAAILFSDIVGYTKVMGADEDKAFEILSKNREIHTQLTQKYDGRLIKEIGDGLLLSFDLASDAVYCAIEIQKKCKKQNIPLKIGIHQGELVVDENDVFGNAVNIASRLEADADQGCINISGVVYGDIKNRSGIRTKFVKEKRFKNVDEPVKVYQILQEDESAKISLEKPIAHKNFKLISFTLLGIVIIIGGIIVLWKFLTNEGNTDLEKSIAVLPLEYLSENPNKEYLANGVMDAITGHLSTIEGLRVMSRASVEQYRETLKTSEQICKELDVSYLIEGSFLMVENQVRLMIQLIVGKDNSHIFFKEYNRDYSDILKVQSELAQTIAKEIGVAISPDVKERIESILTNNQEAYEYFLQAKDYQFKGGESNLNRAINLFKKAIELDPEFAIAYAWLGGAIHNLKRPSDYLKDSYGDTLLYYVNKSIEIDPKLEDGYILKGWYYQEKANYDESIILFQKALELNPNSSITLYFLAQSYRNKRQSKLALINIDKARKIIIGSPEYKRVLYIKGLIYMDVYDYERAKNTFLEIVNYDSIRGFVSLSWLSITNGEWEDLKYYVDQHCKIDSSQCKGTLWEYMGYVGEFDKAVETFERNSSLANDFFYNAQHRLGYIYYKAGKKEKAMEYFDKQIDYCKESIRLQRPYADGSAQYDLAGVYAFLGEKEKAYKIIHAVVDQLNNGLLWYIQHDPLFENLWNDQEFKDIIKQQQAKYAKVRTELDQLRKEGVLQD